MADIGVQVRSWEELVWWVAMREDEVFCCGGARFEGSEGHLGGPFQQQLGGIQVWIRRSVA